MLKHSIPQSMFKRDILGAVSCVLPSAFSTMTNRPDSEIVVVGKGCCDKPQLAQVDSEWLFGSATYGCLHRLDKFEGVDFRRWQKKMHFLLSTMSMVYVLTTPMPEDGENATVEHTKKMEQMGDDIK
ncbi:hypothetical protein Tco_1062193 [Tanacetum coccineum]